jgi:hypothetical protein
MMAYRDYENPRNLENRLVSKKAYYSRPGHQMTDAERWELEELETRIAWAYEDEEFEVMEEWERRMYDE